MSRARSISWAVTAFIVSALFTVPLLTMVTGSLRRPGTTLPKRFELLPSPTSLEAYRDAFGLAPLARALVNSVGVAAVFVPLAVVTASLAGFAIARSPRRGALTALVLLLLMVPVTTLWIARFALFSWLGLDGTYVPLIAPALMGGTPFAVLLYIIAFRRLPADVLDAARLDGASALATWRRIAMPMVRGTTIAVAMLAFVQTWSNVIDPLLYLRDERTFTAPLALTYLETLGRTNFPVLLAGSVIVTLPAVIAFAIAQRRFLGDERGLGWLGR